MAGWIGAAAPSRFIERLEDGCRGICPRGQCACDLDRRSEDLAGPYCCPTCGVPVPSGFGYCATDQAAFDKRWTDLSTGDQKESV